MNGTRLRQVGFHMNFKTDFPERGLVENLIDSLAQPAFVLGLGTDVIHANGKAIALMSDTTGGPTDGVALTDILPLHAAQFFHRWSDTVIDGTAETRTLEIPIPSGAIWNVKSLSDHYGTIGGFLFQHQSAAQIAQPIPPDSHTDAARISALVRTEMRWKTAVLSAKQGVWDHDFENDQHYLSDTWREMRGLPHHASAPLSTNDWLLTIHPEDIAHIRRELARQDAGQTDIVDYTFRQKHADGHWIWILSRRRVVRRDASGTPVHIIGTDTDISDIKAAELERDRLAQRLAMAIEASEIGQWEHPTGSSVDFWDARMLEIYGLTDGATERSEAEWAALIHPDDRAATVANYEDCRRTQRDLACDYRIVTADGTEKFVRSRGKFFPDIHNGDRYIGVNFDISQDHQKTVALELAQVRLEYESRHDYLTGLANRRALDDAFNAIRRTARPGQVAAIHFDIDRFKQINDSLGHDAGDVTLRHIASILAQELPTEVTVARSGGDEFVALFPQAPDDAALLAHVDHIAARLADPLNYQGIPIKVGVSTGIARTGLAEPDCDDLFIHADLALYHAKKDGRSVARFYVPDMKDEVVARKATLDALTVALEQNQIICHYQPQFDARTHELSGVEALVRWQSPEHGLIMPDRFLTVAEEMGLIATIDDIVLRRVLLDLAAWTAAGLYVPHVSVNISGQRLTDPGLGAHLQSLHIPRGKIVFELLESVFLDGANQTVDTNLDKIKSLGIDIEIDDFGTGHASIISLLRLAPRRLKIDRALIQPIVESPTRRALLETIIRIGKMLDIDVIAEGVETPAHVAILRELACDYLQGYALGYPMEAAKLADLIRARNAASA
ncbi:putative bifunctional diguanylate cyclase/phosphodiesterase [Loktanella sp. DJP18]|uniref:putative bifunctional diguanylate cyclase/phosphodiesterase n=1 Tax=Loktanella sp. DJP18 TaxID=3409788 RepID=UPI003BB79481